MTVGVVIAMMLVASGCEKKVAGPPIAVFSLDDPAPLEEKRALFEAHSRFVKYPGEVEKVGFRLEYGSYDDTNAFFGEYVVFVAPEPVIQTFLEQEVGTNWLTTTPTDYHTWHLGVADYSWWNPGAVTNAVWYENSRYFTTVDWTNRTVFHSYVRQ